MVHIETGGTSPLATLRLPVAYTAVFALVALAVLLVLLGTEEASTGLVKSGGYALLLAAAGGAYLFVNSLTQATGGRPATPGQAGPALAWPSWGCRGAQAAS